MKRGVILKTVWQRALYRLLSAVLALVCLGVVGGQAISAAGAAGGDVSGPGWANPPARALQRVAGVDPTRHQPVFLSNLDCTSLTYRLVGSGEMRTGCFVPTAFGLMDSDVGVVIFNGTDEAVAVAPYGPHDVLLPWPRAGSLLTTSAVGTGGSAVSLYRGGFGAARDQTDALGRVIGKQLAEPPDALMYDQAGRRLTINPQTMAFSEGGGWLVAATIYGSFVRINLATQEVLPFASVFYNSSGSAPQDAQVAVSRDGRYVAIQNNRETSLRVYDLAGCAARTTDWRANKCPSYEYWPFVSQRISGLRSITHVRFVDDGLISFEDVTSGRAEGPSTYELAPAGHIGPLIDYLGLGDSYTSGEGAFNYLSGTDTNSNHCHLSAYSYPLLLSQDLFGAGGHSVACSGAIIWDVGNSSGQYRGQVAGGGSYDELAAAPGKLAAVYDGYTPGVIAQHRFLRHYQPRLATVSIGGNDIGFGDILQNCVAPHLSLRPDGQTCYDSYEDRAELLAVIDRTVPRWIALYRQLRAEAPQSRLYAIGYPSVAVADGHCGLNVRLSHDELVFAEDLLAYLNHSIQQASIDAGVPYIDISRVLAGHRLCEAGGNGVAMNGLTAGTDSLGVLGRESYHPNMLGQRLIEQAILEQTDNFRSGGGGAGPPAGDPGRELLSVPRSGRPQTVLVPDTRMLSPVLRPAATSALRVDGAGDGLRPNTTYQIHLDGPAGQLLSTAQSAPDSDLTASVTLPSDTEAGTHTINVTGPNQIGASLNIAQTISVPAAGPEAGSGGAAAVVGASGKVTGVGTTPPPSRAANSKSGSPSRPDSMVLSARVVRRSRQLRDRTWRAEHLAYQKASLSAAHFRRTPRAGLVGAGLLLLITLVLGWRRRRKPPKYTA